ncbi:MAG: hypothetical protein ACRER4_03615 [Steroidobacteraceae bacterium]
MADETITRQVSERYARALATGQQMCCPSSYPFEDLRRFVPEEVLGASYGWGTPAGLAMVTVLDVGSGGVLGSGPYTRRFAVINRAGEPVAGEVLACGLDGNCC